MTPPEKNVSHALSSLGINYKYEPTLFLRYKNGKESIRYPDFYLPHLDLYIEVRSFNRDYDQLDERIRKKNKLYLENNLKWIEVDPAYITREGKRKLKSLEAIYKDVQKKISNYVERKNPGYPMSILDDNILGSPLGKYKNIGLGKSYLGNRLGNYGNPGIGNSRYSSGSASNYV